MSVQAIAFAFAAQGLSPTEKLVLLALSNYADENMRCWPSQRRLAHDTGLSARCVRTTLAKLSEKGLIEREARERDDGSRASDVVHLRFQGEERRAGGGEPRSGHEPSKEPSEEPSEEPLPSSLRSEGARAKVRSSRCPDDWLPKPSTLDFAEAEGLTAGEIERELSKMRDHTFRTPRSDWDATFRNWIRTTRDRQPPRQAKSNLGQVLDFIDQYADRLDRDYGPGARLSRSGP